MLLWFVATAVAAVWFVFRDERFDNRVLAIGALSPDVVDGIAGGMWLGHSVITPLAVMALVMFATRRRRTVRRALLALPIGMFLHLIFDGAFASTSAFWWPVTGLAGPDGALPVVQRGWWNLPLEMAGVVLGVFLWRLFGLSDPGRRGAFMSRGTLGAGSSGGAGRC
jgi:hypothetical protein